MIDAEIITRNKDYFQVKLNQLCKKNEQSCSIHIDLKYKFREKIWINGIYKNKFDDDLWYNEWFGKEEQETRVYPILSDSLGMKWIYVECFNEEHFSCQCRKLHAKAMLQCSVDWLQMAFRLR